MNTKPIEEKFNILYEKLQKEYPLDLSKLEKDAKKEKKIKRLMWLIIYPILTLFLFFLIGSLSNYSTGILIIIFLIEIIGFPIFISSFFSKKSIHFDSALEEFIKSSIVENINENWKYCSNIKNSKYYSGNSHNTKTDYYDANFPKAQGVLNPYEEIQINGNIIESMFFSIFYVSRVRTNTTYKGIYFSILNNNCILDNVYIRSKAFDGVYTGNPPDGIFFKHNLLSNKLDINSQIYNIYANSLNDIPSGLIELLDNFYKSTGLSCDLTISKNKFQIRCNFTLGIPENKKIPSTQYFQKNKTRFYIKYLQLYHINELIKELFKLLSK